MAIHSDILHGLLTLFALLYNTKSWGLGGGAEQEDRHLSDWHSLVEIKEMFC